MRACVRACVRLWMSEWGGEGEDLDEVHEGGDAALLVELRLREIVVKPKSKFT